MDKSEKIEYKIKPEFNFIYELGMPTGRKIRNSIFILLIVVILIILLNLNSDKISFGNVMILGGINAFDFIMIVCYIFILFITIKLVINIVFQILQYRNITYTFYKDYMIYEDTFLNQHKKNIYYSNVKEVEVRRTIWDRILNRGIIVIYTNAENDYSNGLVIYSINNPSKHYEIIEKLINSVDKNAVSIDGIVDKNINLNKEKNENSELDFSKNDSMQIEQEFKDSLKNIK